MPQPYPAKIVWRDAHSILPEWSDEMDREPYIVESVGWLIPGAKKGHKVLVLNIGMEGMKDSGIAIPNAMVESIERL